MKTIAINENNDIYLTPSGNIAIKKDIEHQQFIVEIDNTKDIKNLYSEATIINDKIFKITMKKENVPN